MFLSSLWLRFISQTYAECSTYNSSVSKVCFADTFFAYDWNKVKKLSAPYSLLLISYRNISRTIINTCFVSICFK